MADGRACAPLEDFPLLAAHAAGGPPLAYLDNAATTQKPSCVLDAMDDFYRTACGNPHRSAHALAAAATRLGNASSMSPEELSALAGRLDEINATHLDKRIPVSGTQKELKTLAQAINAMLDRINEAYRSQMRFVSDASHELRTPISVIQGYANLLDRWGKDDPDTMQEAIDPGDWRNPG